MQRRQATKKNGGLYFLAPLHDNFLGIQNSLMHRSVKFENNLSFFAFQSFYSIFKPIVATIKQSHETYRKGNFW